MGSSTKAAIVKNKNWEFTLTGPIGDLSAMYNVIVVLRYRAPADYFVVFSSSRALSFLNSVFPGAKDIRLSTVKRNSTDEYPTQLWPVPNQLQLQNSNSNIPPEISRNSSSAVVGRPSNSSEPEFNIVAKVLAKQEQTVEEFLASEALALADPSFVMSDPANEARVAKFAAAHMKLSNTRLIEHKYRCIKAGFKYFVDSKCPEHPLEVWQMRDDETDYYCPACYIRDQRAEWVNKSDEDETERLDVLKMLDELEEISVKIDNPILRHEPISADPLAEAALRVEVRNHLQTCEEESKKLREVEEAIVASRHVEKAMNKSEMRQVRHQIALVDEAAEQRMMAKFIELARSDMKNDLLEVYQRKKQTLLNLFDQDLISISELRKRDETMYEHLKAEHEEQVILHAREMMIANMESVNNMFK